MLFHRVCFLGAALLGLAIVGCDDASKSGAVPFSKQVAQAQQETDPETRAKLLIRIGYQQGKAQDVAGAESTLQIAEKDCHLIRDAEGQASALSMLAEAYLSIGHRADGHVAVDSAFVAAGQVDHPEAKARSLARVASAQGTVRNVDAALATLKLAEELAVDVEDAQGRALVLCAVAGVYQKFGRCDERDRVFQEGLDFADSLADPKKRCIVTAEIAAKQGQLGDRNAAAATFELAQQSAGEIKDPFSRAYAMGELAERLSEGGFAAKAHEVLAQAERIAEKVPQQDLQMQALQRIRTLMGRLPKPAT